MGQTHSRLSQTRLLSKERKSKQNTVCFDVCFSWRRMTSRNRHSREFGRIESTVNGHHRDRHQLSVLERGGGGRCPAYREFRYSKMTEKRWTGTNARCPSCRGVRLIKVSVTERVDCTYLNPRHRLEFT